MDPKQNIIALIYDFDGTLSPSPMQEYTVLPQIGIKPKKFWDEVKQLNRMEKGDEIITYMMYMLKKANEQQVNITKGNFSKLAKNMKYYDGVQGFFSRINKFVKTESKDKVKVRHYILSSGLKEILDGVSIRKNFHKIFACEYSYNHYGAAYSPKVVVNDTVKTQFLFRVNKGREDILESINEHMDYHQRPIPFSNIIYIGDGFTDVPCMTVTTKNGGYSIAVYKPNGNKGAGLCRKLFASGRVDFIAPANYTSNSELDIYVKSIIKVIIQKINYESLQRQMVSKHQGKFKWVKRQTKFKKI